MCLFGASLSLTIVKPRNAWGLGSTPRSLVNFPQNPVQINVTNGPTLVGFIMILQDVLQQ